ncbi:MAG TPA: hypothetical protein VNQ77_07665 [Frankiaceae bacterium]|nr:hypothetical protein [Frankiaceae bacterium]
MGRAGRYTLSVMAWVAAYAGWSSVIGLVVAALTGDRPREVSPGVSALLTVVGPLVPTLVALWFNDWARDGFPSREQQRAAKAAPVEAAAPEPPEEPEEVRPEVAAPPAPAPQPVPQAPATITAHPLGVPAGRGAAVAPADGFPVAPLLRD